MPSTNDKPVRGDLQPATPDGFKKLIERANSAHQDGLTLVGVVTIGGDHIGGIFVRIGPPHGPNLV